MPPVKLTEVLSFSSEDPNHPADNLLRPDAFRKWKCAAGTSEKQSSVILKLERLTSLNSIDIGNEGSAFVEVLVGREGAADFQVLLVASSFMTPIESRNSTDLNRVRMFGPDKLNKNVAEQKWDRVKVICTQPFNKKLQYGLSFITVRAPDKAGEAEVPTPKITKLGSFTLKDDDEKDPISVGSLFARRKDKEPSLPLSGAAAIRAASAAAAAASVTSTSTSETAHGSRKMESLQPSAHKRKSEAFPDFPDQPKKKMTSDQGGSERNRERKTDERGKEGKRSDYSKTERKADLPTSPAHMLERKGSNRGEKGMKKERGDKNLKGEQNQKNEKEKKKGDRSVSEEEKVKKSRPFANLMEDVVFVLSGYQNPERSQLRDAMLDMGAIYKGDWGPTCTHLVCAFKNTPKYQQVRGHGRIVSSKWITQCHKDKKKYPCNRFELDAKQGRSQGDEEEEIWAEELLPKTSKSPHTSSPQPLDSEEGDMYGDETDVSENEDTDDEIERAKARKQTDAPEPDKHSSKPSQRVKGTDSPVARASTDTSKRAPRDDNSRMAGQSGDVEAGGRGTARENDVTRVNGGGLVTAGNGDIFTDDEVYDDDTDVDEENGEHLTPPDTSSLPLPSLGDYFQGKCFLLYGNMGEEDRKLLHRYITAFLGEVENYMSGKVDFVISEDDWDDNFEEALNEHPSLQFVKPMWVWRCCDKQRLLPHQPYLIVPRE